MIDVHAGVLALLGSLDRDEELTEGSDDDLIRRARRGDRDSFARLVERYSARAYTLARRLVRDPGLAEDLAQEAFLRVYRSLDRFEEGRPFGPWLYTILRNLARNGRRRAVPEPVEVGPGGHEPTACAEGPAARAGRRDTRRRIEAEVAALPAPFREVVVLRYLEDRPVKEVARLLGVPEGTVKTHLFRARRMLRARLGRTLGETS